jgi:hypothetical protein
MRKRPQSILVKQISTLSDCMGLGRMVGSEFQDCCLKPLGHPSKSLQKLGHPPPPTHREMARCYRFATEHTVAPVYGCPRGSVNGRGGILLHLRILLLRDYGKHRSSVMPMLWTILYDLGVDAAGEHPGRKPGKRIRSKSEPRRGVAPWSLHDDRLGRFRIRLPRSAG